MIEIKKSELEPLLLTISTYSAPKEGEKQELVSGLLKENITFRTRRELRNIHKAALAEYQQLPKDIEELKKECGEDVEKLQKELTELFNETVKLNVDRISFSSIENITTSNNYNFDIIDKITI